MKGRHGFTLIEMALVLVIIGIIIGMVLKGRSLIKTADAKKTATQVRQMETKVWEFFSRYHRFPGDCDGDRISDAQVTNDKSGLDNTPDSGFCTSTTTDSDLDRAYAELKQAKIIDVDDDNSNIAETSSGGVIYIGYATPDGGTEKYNAIALAQITCLEAKTLDDIVDGKLDSGKGRVRVMTGAGTFSTTSDASSGPWNSVCPTEDTRISVVYLYDETP